LCAHHYYRNLKQIQEKQHKIAEKIFLIQQQNLELQSKLIEIEKIYIDLKAELHKEDSKYRQTSLSSVWQMQKLVIRARHPDLFVLLFFSYAWLKT
jgi:hypothetical protein